MENALIVEDVQNDFMPGGGYPVPKGDEVVEPINRLIRYVRKNGWLLVFSRDWHPEGMNHCVKNTEGAKFHTDLLIQPKDIIISKGEDTSDRHYSTFNGDNISLLDLLKKNNVENVFIAGLATDYCVLHTALDSVKNGFNTSVVLDACRAVNKNGTTEKEAINKMKTLGIKLIQSDFLNI